MKQVLKTLNEETISTDNEIIFSSESINIPEEELNYLYDNYDLMFYSPGNKIDIGWDPCFNVFEDNGIKRVFLTCYRSEEKIGLDVHPISIDSMNEYLRIFISGKLDSRVSEMFNKYGWKVITKVYVAENKNLITIQEDVQIPGTDVILEKDDKIEVIHDVRKQPNRVCEKLINYSIERLNQECAKRPELEKLLRTPYEDLPNDYKYLILGTKNGKTLYDVITYVNNSSNSYSAFFSESTDNRLIGFVGYFEDITGSKITDIKTFAFDLNPLVNMRLAADLMKMVRDLLKSHSIISFIAITDNPVNREYEKACVKFKNEGHFISITKNKDVTVYTIQSNSLKDVTEKILEAGYNWSAGMSNNAVQAYEDGEKPLSKWNKNEILGLIKSNYNAKIYELCKGKDLAFLKDNFLFKSSYHHTSKFYNKTDFYSFEPDLGPHDIKRLFNLDLTWDEISK